MQLSILSIFACCLSFTLYAMRPPALPTTSPPMNRYPDRPTVSLKSYARATVASLTAGMSAYFGVRYGMGPDVFAGLGTAFTAGCLGSFAARHSLEEFKNRALYDNLISIDKKILKKWQKFKIDPEKICFLNETFVIGARRHEELMKWMEYDYRHCKFPYYSGLYHTKIMQSAYEESTTQLSKYRSYLFSCKVLEAFYEKLHKEHTIRHVALTSVGRVLRYDIENLDQELKKIHEDPLVRRLFKNDIEDAYSSGTATGFANGYILARITHRH